MMKKLHPGVKVSWRIGTYVGDIILAILFLVMFMPLFGVLDISLLGILKIIILLIIILVILTEVWIKLAYNRWFYEFTSTNLKIERGVIFKRYSNIPYERVQNIDIGRGIIARMLGFSTVNIQTAGYSSGGKGFAAEGYIPAVDVKEAENIRDFLMKKISKKSGSDGL